MCANSKFDNVMWKNLRILGNNWNLMSLFYYRDMSDFVSDFGLCSSIYDFQDKIQRLLREWHLFSNTHSFQTSRYNIVVFRRILRRKLIGTMLFDTHIVFMVAFERYMSFYLDLIKSDIVFHMIIDEICYFFRIK